MSNEKNEALLSMLKDAVWSAIREWNGSNHKLTMSESLYLAEHVRNSLGVAIEEATPQEVMHLRVRWEDALAHTKAALALALATQRQAEPVASAADEVTDAQRYRWIRKNSNFMHCNIEIYGNGFEISDTLDEAIDAAMQKDTQ